MSARVLVDQCVSRRMVEAPLSSIVFDVARGAPDPDVMKLARDDNRILITEDYDFDDLVFGERHAPPPGIIHLVLDGMDKSQRDAKFAAEIAHLLKMAPGRFVVFSRRAPRSRPFPP